MNDCPRCSAQNADTARFCASCGASLAPPGQTAEVRKTVTVMFLDAVGSTDLAERADPEALRRVMTRYFDEIKGVVEAHGGIVEKYIGDAVMAVFGVPNVHEDDALRAVRAAAEIRRRLTGSGAVFRNQVGLEVAWRTGINTGEVVAGDAGAGQRFVSGDAVNVAARLEQAAAPDEVLIGQPTFQLVRDAVTVEPVTPVLAKGKSGPVNAYRLLDVAPVAPGQRRLLDTPMVGRVRQQRQLAEAYAQVIDDRTLYLVAILGAAGVGKSRLVSEFLATHARDATILHGRCLSYGEGITYWPVVEAVRQAAALTEDDDDETVESRLGALIDDEHAREPAVERLGGLLGRFDARGATEETFWAVRTLLESLARRQPVVLVLDDLHWAEPTLLDLVEHLAEMIRGAPLMIICMARHELLEVRPGWGGGHAQAMNLMLEPLSDGESHDFIRHLLGQVEGAGAAHLAGLIAAAAEGNPLFVEEMVAMLVDGGQLTTTNGMWMASDGAIDVTIPPTIEALLAARLDSLPPAERTVVSHGAVEGAVFHLGAVAELAPQEMRDSVAGHVRSLSRKQLLRPDRSDFVGEEAYRFRHLLIRDSAYTALPKERRAQLHARFADWLARRAGDHVAQYDEVLAYHYEQAFRYRAELAPAPVDAESKRLARLAAERYQSSGTRALDRGDVTSATKLLSSAVDLLPEDDPSRTRARTELGTALSLSGDLVAASDLLSQTMKHAQAMGDELGAAYAEVARVESWISLNKASVEDTVHRMEQLLPIFERHGDHRARDRAVFELARHHFFAGRATIAEQMITTHLAAVPAVGSKGIFEEWLPAYWLHGRTPVDEAIRRTTDLLAGPISRTTESLAIECLGSLRAMHGEFDEGRALVRRAVEIREELGQSVLALAQLGNGLGPLEIMAEDFAEARRVLEHAHAGLEAAGERGFNSTVLANLAYVYVKLSRYDDAERAATTAREMATEDDVATHIEGLRTLALADTGRERHEAAERNARQALALLLNTDMLDVTGSAYMDLAEVHEAAGKRAEALQALHLAIECFDTKGTTALTDRARRRLAQLGGAP